MNYITIDQALLARLREVAEPVEVRDETGNVIGFFAPARPAEEQALYEKARGQFDPAELERRLREQRSKGVPLKELWDRLAAGEKT
jgi:hypothetical protein